MNILINLYSSKKNENDPFHGGNEYANRVVNELISSNINLNNCLYFFCYSEKSIDSGVAQTIKSDINSFLIENKDYRSLELIIEKYCIDKLFDPLGVSLGTNSLNKIDVIYTIHGLRPIEMPTDINEFYLESKLKYILKSLFAGAYYKKVRKSFKDTIELQAKSKILIAVSEHTKDTIVKEFKVNSQSINVFYSPEKIYPIVNLQDEELFFERQHNISPFEFFLIVSSKRWIKNTYRAIKAFDELINLGLLKHKIVLTGTNKKVERLIKNKHMFVTLDYVETKELEILYKNAFSLVYPSLNEGFGYPPMEAMKYGIPVIASMITSIPEIVDDAALGFNPFSIAELKEKIVQIENDSTLYEDLKVRGLNRYKLINSRQKVDLVKLVNIILS